MKVSVSLPDDDVEFIDSAARESGTSRSAVLHQAISAFRERGLVDEYAAAYAEWIDEGHAEAWDAATGDGIDA